MNQPAWSVVQYTAGDTVPRLGLQVGADIRQLPEEWPTTLLAALADWPRWNEALRSTDPDSLSRVDGAKLLAPLTFPNKIICAGANYYDHAAEMGTDRPDPEAEPFFFLKSPTTTVIGDGDGIPYPGRPDPKLDWEAELAVVIADRCRDVPVEEARSHVAGYLVANDISARGYFKRTESVFPAFAWDWVAHKSLDGFCPIGPGFVPAFTIADPQNLAVTLTVNGVTKQDSSTAQMVVDVDRLVAAASRWLTLEPGDLILTGTPAGVGMPRGDFLSVGDVIVAEVEGVGRLTNTVVAS
ncbi:fumarylacetoacetate hydrolase family protein [Herbiconiux sp. VKM Ac-1786]|uniref:fumarylacetoacetate hydrolase family protein n=1 Tax=Herbiconiux sp. VKM Ac-1786 TaxID=2783824 RepID=UPI00188A6FE6|nr:fumarylacetoacetate hydrolase family protein [Herbiconiux sp. VKM Ac-1786]MBF4571860.1 fumarylacetoacetate hydrolase family protein [Herbiconiux sp. VKM Ac-1786]